MVFMKNLYGYLLAALVAVGFLSSCSQSDGGEGAGGNDVSQTLIGLWSGQTSDKVVHIYDLRVDGTAVASSYWSVYGRSVGTKVYPEWSARGGVLQVGSNRMYCSMGHIEMLDPSTFEKVPMLQLYHPGLDVGTIEFSRLSYYKWTGYYEDKVITLEFKDDGTMTRLDEPNVGYEGEPVSTTYEWSISDNVMRFAGHDEAWGVAVEEDFSKGCVIFIDFGDVASGFIENIDE